MLRDLRPQSRGPIRIMLLINIRRRIKPIGMILRVQSISECECRFPRSCDVTFAVCVLAHPLYHPSVSIFHFNNVSGVEDMAQERQWVFGRQDMIRTEVRV